MTCDIEILNKFIRKSPIIISDGDWDGIMASGILLMYARNLGIQNLKIEFPAPPEWRGLELEKVIAIEIVPTKVRSIKRSLIIDHHEGPKTDPKNNNEWIFDGGAKSAAEVIYRFLSKHAALNVPQGWLDAINAIDSGNPKASQLSWFLWSAFRADVRNFPREKIAQMIADERWHGIIKLLKPLSEKYEAIEATAKMLVRDHHRVGEKVAYFIYGNDDVQRSASKPAMLELEKQYDIVAAIEVDGKLNLVNCTLGTMNGELDLTPVFEKFRALEYNAGGRKTIGGIQPNNFEIHAAEFIEVLAEILRKTNLL